MNAEKTAEHLWYAVVAAPGLDLPHNRGDFSLWKQAVRVSHKRQDILEMNVAARKSNKTASLLVDMNIPSVF